MPEVTRFAPSPTGWLHLGHAYSAGFASEAAGPGGRFLLRIEDLDYGRVRPEYLAAIEEDLAWLGLDWERPVLRQSEHLAFYRAGLQRLIDAGLCYPCFCTRSAIQQEIRRMAAAPQGPDGPIYPGTCRQLDAVQRQERIAAGEPHAWRLDVAKAARQAGALCWTDLAQGTFVAEPGLYGDVLLSRKEIDAVAYHLAVVLDDARQGVTLVTRGLDLLPASHLHRLLQALLALPVPRWLHHRLVTDGGGRRLAKRDDALAIRTLRERGHSPQDVRRLASAAPAV
ncbi:MAG TPA: tRNA glutamyl-Q(34) synthetase GluQRS [Kiloniellales bacterium]|nr:tRNA glutamyl-Q(34) synthetase GluQRS [Kiloniellales bacterium]